jgi:pimeloyl-ACP methyl ester carboxylesterase
MKLMTEINMRIIRILLVTAFAFLMDSCKGYTMINVNFKNSKNISLVGSLWQTDSDAIIVMAHGSGSNRFARGLYEKLAIALQAEHYNVLSFDFSGHGESGDVIFNTQRSVEDLEAALQYVRNQGYKRIALFGHSFGSLTCLKFFSPDIETMILLGALTGPVNWKWKEYYTPEQLQQIEKDGYITSEVNDGLRATIKTDVHVFQEILSINQQELLKHVTCPVLMIHGDDQDEQNLLEFSKKALSLLPAGSELKIIPGASHIFLDHSNEVIKLSKDWYSKHFPLEYYQI